MMISITARIAANLMRQLGLEVPEDMAPTWYATNEEWSEIWDFSSKRERDKFVRRCNEEELGK